MALRSSGSPSAQRVASADGMETLVAAGRKVEGEMTGVTVGAAVLLVLYPLIDVVASVIDAHMADVKHVVVSPA